MPGTEASLRDRLAAAAFELFEDHGFENTTVDDIAQRAGVGRTTFFRIYRSKEDVIFPEHDQLLAQMDARLAAATPETREIAISEAARVVLRHYLKEGPHARTRYRLTRAVPALRSREVAGMLQYQHLFARYLRRWCANQTDGDLRAEVVAVAVVAAHNHVLRRWLRDESAAPEDEFDHAMALALEGLSNRRPAGTVVAVLATSHSAETVLAKLRQALDQSPSE